MRKAKIGELRNNLSRSLDHVRAGGRVVVYDRDTAIAELRPIKEPRKSKQAHEQRLIELERMGAIQRGKPGDGWLRNWTPIRVPAGKSLSEIIIDDREDRF